jgi:hypothetical protein
MLNGRERALAKGTNWIRLIPPKRWTNDEQNKSGRSAAWLARYLGVVEVVGSNPAGPIFYFSKRFVGESPYLAAWQERCFQFSKLGKYRVSRQKQLR